MSPSELLAIIGVTFSIAVVVALKLSKPTIINNYAPKAEAHADAGGSDSGSPGSVVGVLFKVGLAVILLAVAVTVISAITNIATRATNAISDAVSRPVVVQQQAPPPSPPVEVPAQAPAPAPIVAPAPSSPFEMIPDFIAAGGWIPLAIVVALVLTRPRGQRAHSHPPETVYYPPRQNGDQARGIPAESVPLFAGAREKSRK